MNHPRATCQTKSQLLHHVNVGHALYSVPSAHLGKRVWVRSDRKLVRIYRDGALIKTHPRQQPGGKSTDYHDYPAEKSGYAMRDPDRLVRQARGKGDEVGAFMSRLLAGPTPWARLRQAQKLVRLGDKYGWQRLEAACERANAFELTNVVRVERILLHDLDRQAPPPTPAAENVEQPPLRFQRPATSFNHHAGDDS